MPRQTICIAVDEPDEVEEGARWLVENRHRLAFISENYGCGCCVDLYDLEAPAEVLATLPDSIRISSKWTRGGVAGDIRTEP